MCTLNDSEKFIFLMQSNDAHVITWMAKFVYRSMSKRSDKKKTSRSVRQTRNMYVCVRGCAHTLAHVLLKSIDHVILSHVILFQCDCISSHVYLANWFYHKVQFYFSFYRLVLDVHVYVLLYISYVLCFIVYFISCTLDKSAMTSIKTYIYVTFAMGSLKTKTLWEGTWPGVKYPPLLCLAAVLIDDWKYEILNHRIYAGI